VHSRERYPHGTGVLIYLARYLRGGPIANRRLLAWDGQQVVFRYAERAKGPGNPAQQRTMSLPLEQFLGRWLLHVRHRTWCGCAAGACMPTRKEKRWRGAGSKWARGRSRDAN
jgi:Putative transposase